MRPLEWYCLHLYDGGCSPSPVRVHATTRSGPLNERLEVNFWHLWYPAGVQDKQYCLQVLRETTDWLVAAAAEGPAHLMVFFHLPDEYREAAAKADRGLHE